MAFTNEQKHECALREVRQRRRVYPRLIEQAKMSPSTANDQILMMEEIAADYGERCKGDRLI